MIVFYLLCLLAATEAESKIESSPLKSLSEIEKEEIEIRSLDCCSEELGDLPEQTQYKLQGVRANIQDIELRLNERIKNLQSVVTDLHTRMNELGQLARGNDVISDIFNIYSCPLSIQLQGVFKCTNENSDALYKKETNGKRVIDIDVQYGITHAFVQIGSYCYDWGTWNFPQKRVCEGPKLHCCWQYKTLKYTNITNCADRIHQFQTAWDSTGKKYNVFNWNCQTYTKVLKDFLLQCSE